MKCILFYKPYAVLTQFTGEPPTLKDYIPVSGVYPVGRLDRDSEGLILLTDDGKLQHRLSDPKYGHPRTYWVQVEGIPDEDAIQRLAEGVLIQGRKTLPAEAKRLKGEPGLPERNPPIRVRQSIPTSWLEITLREGRNRQVRRMTAAVGHPTLRLVRVAIGGIGTGGLRPGEWRELSRGEYVTLKGLK